MNNELSLSYMVTTRIFKLNHAKSLAVQESITEFYKFYSDITGFEFNRSKFVCKANLYHYAYSERYFTAKRNPV